MLFAVLLIAAVVGTPATEESQVDQAKAALEARLRDPMSVVYRNLKVSPAGVCGEYNAKNGYGGYAGFITFGWSATSGKLWSSDPNTSASDIPTDVLNEHVAAINELGCSTPNDWVRKLKRYRSGE
jgi:hypothetical protein